MKWLRRMWYRHKFADACERFIYWLGEEDFLWKALGERSAAWDAAIIEQKRAERDMDRYGKLGWPEDEDHITTVADREVARYERTSG